MPKPCDHCGEETVARFVLHHVHFDKAPVSSMRSEMLVCPDCRDELDDDPDVSWGLS